MTQNSMRLPWSSEEVDERLHTIMRIFMRPVSSTVPKKMVT